MISSNAACSDAILTSRSSSKARRFTKASLSITRRAFSISRVVNFRYNSCFFWEGSARRVVCVRSDCSPLGFIRLFIVKSIQLKRSFAQCNLKRCIAANLLAKTPLCSTKGLRRPKTRTSRGVHYSHRQSLLYLLNMHPYLRSKFCFGVNVVKARWLRQGSTKHAACCS